ncbi:hypothetical protein NC653_027988 [Populus alba x Populus x berolinensis]|uniref:Uncharacterized protein n=1 Tax=Populus alba x Populus x berolinensis TaxID=444605 RepID=A0AAD6M7P7_9ROSI|nr:hypothetical protein NC653_027988 [Populus alba x Populus x berolinensis]
MLLSLLMEFLSQRGFLIGIACRAFSPLVLFRKREKSAARARASNKCDSEGLPSINKHCRTVFVCTYIANVVSLT